MTSKRWEISREGIEDYELLYLLNESLEKAKIVGYQGPELRQTEIVLQEIPKVIEQALYGAGRRIPLNNNNVPQYTYITELVQEARQQIITACMRLNDVIQNSNIR